MLGQVVVDNSFGSAGALSGPNFKIPDTLGKTVEGNLFHSFSEFSLQTGQSSTFTGPDSIQNIIGRVTGGKVSQIDGLIQSEIADANLYLLNPNGFLFGKNAKVDVDGSFTVSTRESLKLGEDGSFNAINADQSVFVSAAPEAFGFLGENPGGKIMFQGSRIVTGSGIGLVGGEVELDKARVLSVGELVSGDITVESSSLTIRDGQLWTQATASGNSGAISVTVSGDIQIEDLGDPAETGAGLDRGEFIESIRNRGWAYGDITGLFSISNGVGEGGHISVSAKGNVDMVAAGVYSINKEDSMGNTGKAGAINFESTGLVLSNSQIAYRTINTMVDYGVSLKTKGNISITGGSYIDSSGKLDIQGANLTINGSLGSASELFLSTISDVSVTEQSSLEADTLEWESAGLILDDSEINVQTLGIVSLSGYLSLDNQSRIAGGLNSASVLSIDAKEAVLNNESVITSGHSIKLNVAKFNMKGGSVVEVESKIPELADAPVLNMNADSLNLSGGSNISLKTNEQGGSLDAKIEGNLMLESGSTIQLNQGGGDHPKGLLGITAENITIDTGGIIGDSMEIEARGDFLLGLDQPNGISQISTDTTQPPGIKIKSKNFISNSGFVYVKGQGQGGNVEFSAGIKPKLVISALEHVSLDKGSGLMIEGTWSPEGGVFIDAKNITLRGGSSFYFFMQKVSSEVKESGVPTGANIRLVAEDDITMQNIQTFWIVPPFPLDGKAERWGLLFDANNIKLDNSRMDAFNYYNLEANAGEKFLDGDMEVTHPIGYMQFELKANNEITLMNQSAVYISSGRLGLNGRNISLIDSEVSQNVFRADELIKKNGLIELIAVENINMVNAQLNSNTWSENSRMDIAMNSKVLNLENTVVSNRDYIQGKTGEMKFDVAEEIKLKNSSILSLAEGSLDMDTNANDINISAGNLLMEGSMINTATKSFGEKGTTYIDVPGEVELIESWVGGINKPLKMDGLGEARLDGSLSDEISLQGEVIELKHTMGWTSGPNLFYSLSGLTLKGGQTMTLTGPENIENIILRITGDEYLFCDGKIKVEIENANLLLMSPNGVVLGPNAGFVLNGDLHVTGNDSILFEDQSVFYSDIKLKHNLTKADPIITLQPDKKNSFIRFIGTSIIDQGNGAEDKIESNYIFVGDDLEFKRGASVGLYGGGDIVAAAKSIRMSEFSGLLTVSPTLNKGGDIKLTADHILMEDTLLETSAQAGVGGDIYLIADDIEINDGGFGTFSYYSGKANSGRAGSSTLKARDSLRLNSGKIHSISFTSAGGSGNIEVDTGELIMDGGTLSSPAEFKSVAYRGSTGNVLINASKMRTSNARFQVEALQDLNYVPTSENYGDLKIKAEEADFGVLSIIAATRQKNGSSDILIDVSGDLGLGEVTIQGRGTVGDNEGGRSLTEGVGGNLIINAKNIFGQTDYIKGQGQQLRIFSTGSIHLNAEEKIHLGKAIFGYDNISPKRRHEVRMTADEIQLGFKPEQNPNKTASVEFDYDFEKNMSPEIFLNAQNNLRINPGAIIKASQFGISAEESILQDVQLNLGWGGDHLVKGKGSLQLAGSTMIQINASGVSGGWQKAGTLKFHSQKLIVDSDVSILSSTKGGEQSASLVLDAENFTLDGGLIQTVTSGMGRAGDVSLRANSSSIQNGGSLGSKTEGEGASGDIHVEGGRLVLDGESSLRSGVDLNAEEMSLDAIGDAGAVTINVESISLSGGSYVASTALDMGQSKDVNVKASSIMLGEQSYITSTSQVTEEVGAYGFFEAREERELTRNGGISLTGKAIELSSGSYLKTTTNLPYRQAGDIVIKGESIVLAGGSAVVSNTEPSGQVSEAMAALGMGDQTPNYGNAGTVEIEGHTVIVAGGSRVASDSFTDGDGGNVSIKADTLNLQDRGRIYAGALNRGGGGQISIETEKLNAEGQASIVADVRDSGQGGKVSIHADEMNLDQASVYGSTSGEGAGSHIQVQANELNLFNGARVESVAFGLGQAGGLDIAADTVSISGQSEWFDPKDVDAEPSGHVARSGFVTSTEARGAAGTIHLNTLKLDLDGGVISSASTDWGAAGSINIGISETILMRNHGQISVRSALANGGDITIQTDGHVLVDDSELSASAELDGGSVRLYGGGNFFLRAGQITAEAGQDGGNIFVEAPETLVLQKGRLSANAIRGQGGYILITANGFLPSIETSVTASSEFGVQGTVEIRSPDTDVGSSLVVLSDKLSSRSVNLAERCALRLQGDVSSFFMNGQGGLPVWSKENYLPETIQVRM